MIIFNAQGRDTEENPVAILTREAQAPHVPANAWSHRAVCTSAEHLAALLGAGHEEWVRFRDKAIGKSK
jgi:hypothetical protein